MKLVLFDCDETLWTSKDQDYISSVESELEKANATTIVRTQDKKIFSLKPDVEILFKELSISDNQICIGIVSDNLEKPVKDALKLFSLWSYVHQDAFNVRLWKGPCPKEVMIQEIVLKPTFKQLSPSDVYLIDDKDYSQELQESGFNFIRVNQKKSLDEVVRNTVGI